MTTLKINFARTINISCAILLISLPVMLPAQNTAFIEHQASATNGPSWITAGPDGALWYTDSSNSIGRITTGGIVTEFPYSGEPQNSTITAGPDGALWFTEAEANLIGRITTLGIVTTFAIPTPNSSPAVITSGPDGALWFTEFDANQIGRITTSGAFTEYPILTANGFPSVITTGPDGALWFTQTNVDKVGRITTSGAITEFPVTAGTGPFGIAAGPDGNLWFTGLSNGTVGRMTTGGFFTEYPTDARNSIYVIAAGSDGAMWFSDLENYKIGRVTTSGAVTEYTIPTANVEAMGIASGPDGVIWFTEFTQSKIGQVVLQTAALSATPDAGKVGSEATFSGSGFAPNETVNFYANSTSLNLLNTAVADASGSFVISGETHVAPYGSNSVTGVGQTSGKLAVAPFSIQPKLTLTPATATEGTTIAINGFGFGVDETVTFYWSAGGIKPIGTVATNVRGTFYQTAAFTFTIPVGTQPGQYSVVAKGAEGESAGAYLTVQ